VQEGVVCCMQVQETHWVYLSLLFCVDTDVAFLHDAFLR